MGCITFASTPSTHRRTAYAVAARNSTDGGPISGRASAGARRRGRREDLVTGSRGSGARAGGAGGWPVTAALRRSRHDDDPCRDRSAGRCPAACLLLHEHRLPVVELRSGQGALQQALGPASTIEVRESGCMGLCSRGPMVRVERPDGRDALYESVTPELAPRIAATLTDPRVTPPEQQLDQQAPFFTRQVRIVTVHAGRIDRKRWRTTWCWRAWPSLRTRSAPARATSTCVASTPSPSVVCSAPSRHRQEPRHQGVRAGRQGQEHGPDRGAAWHHRP